MSVRLPRLMDNNLDEIGRLHPSRLQADINMTPLSRATMSLPGGEPAVPIRAFVEIYNNQGSLGVYRVSSCVPDYGKGQTIGLKHGLTVLSDAITGNEETIEGNARQVIDHLLAYQVQKVGDTSFWALGRVDVPDSVSVSVPGERANVLQTLLDILKLPGINGRYMYTFDQSVFPWVLNIIALTDEDASEARLGRNLTDISPTYDDSELATRVYAEELSDGYMDAVSPFGVVAVNLDIPEGVDASEYAQEYLDAHKEPRSQIRLDALELFQLTGDALDRFHPGHMCLVPLPAYGAMLHYRVVTLTYEDLMSDPESVTVEISNARDDTSYRLASQGRQISANAGNIARNSSKITTQGIDLRKTQADLVELDGSVATRFNEVGVALDAADAKLTLYATQTYETIDGLRSRISSAEITLDGANARIELEAQRTDTLTSELNSAKLSIDAANAEISLKVSKDGVISTINQSPESVTISASRINLSGYVTASQLSAVQAQLANLSTGTTQASLLYTQNLTATNTVRLMGHTCGWGSKSVCTGVHYSKELQNVPGGNGVTYAVISSVTVWGDYETINYMTY